MALPATRTLTIIAVTAVISLGAGLGLSRMITSPADAAANAAPPIAGPITVPVERRPLSNDVVMRGDAVYEDPLQVTLETGDLGGQAVVTGQVPEVGATIDAGAVILEVTGRPVILLTGELPVYRTLRAGLTGPDVIQLKEALAAVGLDPGDRSSASYDAATARAVAALYAKVGYPAPIAGSDELAAAKEAPATVRAAEAQATAAQRDLAKARTGLSTSEKLRLQNAVDVARARLAEAVTTCSTDPDQCMESVRIAAQGELDVAKADLAAASVAPETSGEQSSLDSAQRALAEAKAAQATANTAVLTPMPAGELVYLPATPRRVDTVAVKRGSLVSGTAVMSVSGATLQIAGNVADVDAALIVEGMPVTVALPGGGEVPGTVANVGGDAPDGTKTAAGRTRITVVPADLTADQRAELLGANVRVTLPVGSTDGEVLAVPLPALTAGPGGEARVEVMGTGGITTLVTVKTGLAADGYVEVSAIGGKLVENDLVVVGQSAGAKSSDDPAADDEPSSEPSTDGTEG